MRLLRFTSSDPAGIFNSYLNQELEIKPDSQIALGAVALEIDDNDLVIDATNSVVTFQCSAGQIRTFRLAHGNYTSANFQDLFDDFMDKANAVLGAVGATGAITSAAEVGKQVVIRKAKNGKNQIGFNFVNAQPFGTDITLDAPQKDLGAGAVRCVDGTAQATSACRIFRNAATGNADYRATTAQRIPISRGCGVHRARLETLTNSGGGGAGALGASISLHKATAQGGTGNPLTYIDNRDMVIGDIEFGIKALSQFGGGGGAQNGYYQFILNGVLTDPAPADRVAISATGVVNTHDVMALEVCQGQVRGVVYKNVPGQNAAQCNVLFSVPHPVAGYVATYGELSASYTLHGAGTSVPNPAVRLGSIRYTPDPYLMERVEGFSFDAFPVDPETGDGPIQASTPTGQSPAPSNHDLQFTGTEVSSWLGFDTARQPSNDVTGFLLARNIAFFNAQNVFQSLILNDCFMVEMLNLNIDSYDFFDEQRQRKNILAFLPFNDTESKCIFQPSNQNFLDLNNKHSIRLNEVKLRIVRKDYSEVQLVGLSSVVVFIKEKGEG